MSTTTRERLARAGLATASALGSLGRAWVRLFALRRAGDERREAERARARREAAGAVAKWAGERGPGDVTRPADGPAKGEGDA